MLDNTELSFEKMHVLQKTELLEKISRNSEEEFASVWLTASIAFELGNYERASALFIDAFVLAPDCLLIACIPDFSFLHRRR